MPRMAVGRRDRWVTDAYILVGVGMGANGNQINTIFIGAPAWLHGGTRDS